MYRLHGFCQSGNSYKVALMLRALGVPFMADAPGADVEAFLKTRIGNCFSVVDKHLAKQPWIVGDAPTIADFSMCGYLFFPPEESGIDVAAQYPNIGAWLERVRGLPGWCDPYAALPGERIRPKR